MGSRSARSGGRRDCRETPSRNGCRRRATVAPKYERGPKEGKRTAYEATLLAALKADAQRSRQHRRTARALFAQIRAQGYRGGYSAVTDFIRAWRADAGAVRMGAFVPLRFEPGEAFQFDWSEEGIVVGGVYHQAQVAHLKLCASRAFWLVAYPSQGHEMLFDAHTRSFSALGGVARRGIYVNMKTAVDKVRKGKGRIVNARFTVMCAHYLFDADFCNVASGWEKGVVEKNVQDSRRRIWIEAQTRKWSSFEELNAWLGERCRALWSEIRHPEYQQFSVAEMLEQERTELMPMPTVFDGYVERSAKVSNTCLVAVARNRYSVPCELAGQRGSTRLYPSRVEIAADDMLVARHPRLSDRGHICYDWQHYIALIQRKPGALRNGAPFADMPAPLLRLRQGLMRHAGGDKTLAQVLNCVPSHGLEAVLVAVELVIESGALSTEHVLIPFPNHSCLKGNADMKRVAQPLALTTRDKNGAPLPLPNLACSADLPLLSDAHAGSRCGLMITDVGMMMVCITPIRHTNYTGDFVDTTVMVRPIDAAYMEGLYQKTGSPFALHMERKLRLGLALWPGLVPPSQLGGRDFHTRSESNVYQLFFEPCLSGCHTHALPVVR